MSKHLSGPSCRNCDTTEARCAYLAGCCGHCSHWRHLTADGNDRAATGRPRLPVEHGTQRGYDQHRARHEAACFACRRAHTETVREVAS